MSKYSSSGAEWDRTRLAVFARDDFICQLCGIDLTTLPERERHADHIIPKAPPHNGSDDMSNLRAACGDCNRRLSDKGNPVRVTWLNPRYFDAV